MHTRGASLIDAALGVDSGARPPPASTSPSAGSASAATTTSPTQNAVVANTSWVGPVWGSFERNTGTWTPYSPSENALIERAFADPSTASVEVPTCFNAVVHFDRTTGGYHHQITPAFGTKPAGFRSVLRGQVGEAATLYWCMGDTGPRWQLDSNAPPAADQMFTQQVVIEPPITAEQESFTWQWCDLMGSAAADAREINWHAYALEQNDEIEAAWASGRTLEIVIGLTTYKIGQWSGTYGTQTNMTTNAVRQVRRGRFTVEANTPADYQDESCALCTEKFADTPEWPIRRTPCNHAFHWTCLQHLLRQRAGQAARCPMCRQSLAGLSASDDGVGQRSGTGAAQLSAQATGLQRHPVNHPSQGRVLPWEDADSDRAHYMNLLHR